MSDMEKFDEYFRRSFDGYSPEVPSHIWENIAARKKKKKPVAFWMNRRNLLALAALLVITTGSVLLFNQKNNSKNIALETNVNGRQQGTGIIVPSAVEKNKAATNPENMPATSAVDNIVKDKKNIQPPNSSKNNFTAGAKKNAAIDIKENMPGEYTDMLVNTKGRNNTDVAGTLPGNKNKIGLYKKSTTQGAHRKAPADNPAYNSINQEAAIDAAQQELLTPALPGSKQKISLSLVADWHNQSTVIKPIKIPDCPEAEKDAAGNKSYFEAYIGPDYAFKKYSDTGNSALIERRKETMRFHTAFSAGIRYTRVFGNGMSIRTGFNYSQIKEKFSYLKENVVQINYVINSAGDTTESYYVRGTRYKNSYNHYHTVDVPLVVGYELGNGRLHANINAGVMLNIYSWQKGETLDNNYLPVSFTTGKKESAGYQYKTNLGVGFTAALSVYYKMHERLHLLAEPYCRFNLSAMNKDAVSLQEKFNSIGLRLGLRVDLK